MSCESKLLTGDYSRMRKTAFDCAVLLLEHAAAVFPDASDVEGVRIPSYWFLA